jgi:MFS transporter, ACS family, hexuronate transporter
MPYILFSHAQSGSLYRRVFDGVIENAIGVARTAARPSLSRVRCTANQSEFREFSLDYTRERMSLALDPLHDGIDFNEPPSRMKPERRYETQVVGILCLTYGIVIFEMFGTSNLLPFIQKDLKLTNTQVGFLLSGFWVTFSVSSYVTGTLTDKWGRYKATFLYALIVFAVASVLSGLASSFATLLAARLLMGLLEGPVYLLPQSITVLESPAERSGLNMGIVTNMGAAIVGMFVAPLLLVNLAVRYNWRTGFFVVALPGLIGAALVAAFLRDPNVRERGQRTVQSEAVGGWLQLLRLRNVWLCAVISCFVVAYVTVNYGFLPLFFFKVRNFSPQQLSLLMSTLGISSLVLGVVLPAASDRLGRKPVMLVSGLLSLLCPLGAMYYTGSIVILAVLVFVGWGLVGAATLTFATIPGESVPPHSTSTAIGLILGVSTLIGGVAGPALAGLSADRWGLATPLIISAGCGAIIVVLCLALRETAPGKVECSASAQTSARTVRNP